MQFRRIEHDVVDSTNERAFAALADGSARHGDAHSAREQLAGRGRRGATWRSERDVGLYVSVVLLPAAPLHPAALTMAGGLAAFDLARDLGVGGARLKWPNDLVVDSQDVDAALGAKLAGVLVETRGLDPTKPHYVLGIGVNVEQREFPPELSAERAVTSLALCGVDVQIGSVRDALLERLGVRIEQVSSDPDALCRDFVRATALAGRRVQIECGDERVDGVFEGLSLTGLAVRVGTGVERRCALEHVRSLRRSGD